MQLTTVTAIATLAAAAQAAPSPNLWGWGGSGWGSASLTQWTSQVPKTTAPWISGCKPAFCSNSLSLPNIPKFNTGDIGLLCQTPFGFLVPFCQTGNKPCQAPPANPPGNPCNPSGTVCQKGYQQTQKNYVTTPNTGVYSGVANTGAAASDPSYMTYGLVSNSAECLSLCDQTMGCAYVNVYQAQYPPNETPKDLSATAAAQYVPGQLTCAMFSQCLGNSAYTNYGGQNDPSFITNSQGFCKAKTCSS